MTSEECLARLEQFKKLEVNWDSYDGRPISHIAISKVKDLIEGLFIAPLNDGGVQLELGEEDLVVVITRKGKLVLISDELNW